MKKFIYSLLAISILITFYSCDESGAKNSNLEDVFPKVISVDSLANTNFLATLNTTINQNENQIYCSTLLYAWLEIKTELKDKIKTRNKSLKLLNSTNSYSNSLAKNEIETTIFVDNNTIKASAKFMKLLPFSFKFIRNKYPLLFNNVLVESFGINGHDESKITNQISIIYYKNDSDFSIKISPKNQDQEIYIYLPKKANQKSLGDLVDDLNKKIEKRKSIKKESKNYWRYIFDSDDRFCMPVITFNIVKDYHQMIGANFKANGEVYSIERISQRIAFILDENGAIIESEAAFEASTEAFEQNEPEPKHLILDQPFFIMLKKNNTPQPYFVAWVNNEEILIQKK